MRILQLTDLHYRMKYPSSDQEYLRLLSACPSLSRRLELCLRRPDCRNLDGILLTGDLTDYGAPEDFASLKREISRFFPGVPVAVTPGNHDGKSAFRTGWTGEAAGDAPWNAVIRLGGLTVLSLDSSREGANDGFIDEAQCVWLAERLEELRGPAILITHFHLLSHQHPMNSAAYPSLFFRLVAQSRLLGVFCGHTHDPYAGFFAGKPYYTAPGFSFHGVRDADNGLSFEPVWGYGLYSVQESGIMSCRFESFRV